MVQQSQNAWQERSDRQSEPQHNAPSVAEWMQSVLGDQQQPPPPAGMNPSSHSTAPATPHAAPESDNQLQDRLAAIARNIETLESKVAGDDGSGQNAVAAAPTEYQSSAAAPASPDPLEALRRRKRELENGPAVQEQQPPIVAEPTTPVPQPIPVQPEPSPSATPSTPSPSNDALDRLSSRLDEQFGRITQAIGDVRILAETSQAEQVSLNEKVSILQSRINETPSSDAPSANSQNMAELSDQIRAVQEAISSMPKPQAMQSLEEGYHHVLARLDSLKGEGTSEDKIDALYSEVSRLRDVLDKLGQTDTGALVGEMRAMISSLEADPHNQQERIAQALENVQNLAGRAGQGVDSSEMHDSIGAVVERLVALEARIDALASGQDDSAVTQRLDAIQSEMARLSTFQDEARGLTSALDNIREEMRTVAPHIDLSGMDQRFSALDRIEAMTGGYANQVSALTERLSVLDAKIGSQSDMAHEVAALSRQMATFQQTVPVREIEHALLDLTGRVTTLQEDTSAERLALAVRELGERVESCLKSIPKTDSIVEAVEAKIDNRMSNAIDPLVTRLDGVDQRLDGIQRAISSADGPLIDQMAKRLEGLIAAMPTPRADEALGALEKQLGELNKRQASAGMVSREEVERLHNELARARASVELGSNRDLQRAIVDQVRHLADRFDNARTTGDAAMLPEIENQIESLAGRVQALGLFDPASDNALTENVVERLQSKLDQTVQNPAIDALQTELVSLRETASDQDRRMHDTLENVQTALETVIRRINSLESDDKAASALAETASQSTPEEAEPSLQDVAEAIEPKPAFNEPVPTASLPTVPMPSISSAPPLLVDADETPAPVEPSVETPEPGDAQDLLKQLSGAMGTPPTPPAPDPSVTPRRAARRAARAMSASAAAESMDAANQRASFIAAARRAAQAAALEVGGGTPAPAAPAPRSKAATKTPAPAINVDDHRLEPKLEEDASSSNKTEGSASDQPEAPKSEALTPAERAVDQLGGAAKTARKEQTEKKAKEEKRQRFVSRAMLVALVLFTVALGLFVFGLIMPDRSPSTVIAPLAPNETTIEGDAAPAEELGAGEPMTDDMGTADSPRIVGDDAMAVDAMDGSETDFVAANAADGQDADLSGGFERDRGPVMAETPQVGSNPDTLEPNSDELASNADVEAEATLEQVSQPTVEDTEVANAASASADPRSPPANDLGPLLNLPIPALPASTADALPEAIGSPRLRVAAAGGDPNAAFEVATRFMEGRFVTQDLSAAAHWYGRAADQGIIPAAYRLGSFYEQGRGVDRDRDAAIAWYERAALGGNPRAMHNLAVMAAEGGGGSPDFSRAAGWFIPAANRGLPDSQFNLAVLFARGMGVERDLMESYKWFALAANGGDTEAIARRDEVAGVLGEQALALATAQVDNWRPVTVEPLSVAVPAPSGGWDDNATQARAPSGQDLIAEAQALLAQRGYDPGPADGLLGPRTNEAVRAFRQSAGLGDSQIIDQTLLDALRSGAAL